MLVGAAVCSVVSAVLRDRGSDAWSRVTATRLLGPSLREPRPLSPVASSTVSFVCGSRALALPTHVECTLTTREKLRRLFVLDFSRTHLTLITALVSKPLRRVYVAILPIGSAFSCGICGLCPGPPAEGPVWNSSICGKLSHVARSPSGLRPIEKMSLYIASSRHDILKRQHRLEKPIRACLSSLEIVCDIFGSALGLNPNPSPWKFKFDPEEKLLSSAARVKWKSSPLLQKFIGSTARVKSRSSPLPQKFLSTPAREKQGNSPHRANHLLSPIQVAKGSRKF